MEKFLFRRILSSIPTILGVIIIIFIILRLMPADPAIAILGETATEETLKELRIKLNLDKPLHSQFFYYFEDIFKGNFGKSFRDNKLVISHIKEMLPHTILLTISGVIISLILGIPSGIISARRRNSFIDHSSRVLALLGISMPAFYLGILLLIFFAFKIAIFPIAGAGEFSNPIDVSFRLVLPAMTLGLIQAAVIMRITRSSMLEILNLDYIRTARAKGLTEFFVIYKHGLRNSLISVITIAGLNMGHLIGGAVLTESVFSRPGLGKLLVEGIKARDYPLVQGTLLFIVLLIILINLTVDICYGITDPRVKYK